MPWDDPERAWMRVALRRNLACSKSLVELTSYDNVAMWWWADYQFDEFVRQRLSARNLKSGSEDELANRGSRRLSPLSGRARALIMSIRYKIEFVLLRRSTVFDVVLALLLKTVLRLFDTKDRSRPYGRRKIVFTAEDIEWRAVRDEETGRNRKSDAFFDSTLRKLIDRYECVGVFPVCRKISLRSLLGSVRIVIEKSRSWYVRHKPFELYWSPETKKVEKDARRHFRAIWLRLLHDAEFMRICEHIREHIDPSVIAMLEYHFRVTFPNAARYIEMAKRMLEVENPALVLLEEEYGTPFELALVAAARKMNVSTLAVQHGVIYPEHAAYMHKGDISHKGSAGSPFYPIASKTAVYGPYHERLLRHIGGYPQGSVVVTGQPRYDRLSRVERYYSKKRFLSRHDIDPSQKIILWTTECHGLSMAENILNIKCVLNAMQCLKNAKLIIKPHPGEGVIYAGIIRAYLAEFKTNALMTPPNSDTFELLHACDLLITKTSTTAMEAIALYKPVILLNLSGKVIPTGLDYVKNGVAVEVSRGDDLRQAIERLLADDSQLAGNRKTFLKEYLHRLDGNAAERVATMIREMTQKPMK